VEQRLADLLPSGVCGPAIQLGRAFRDLQRRLKQFGPDVPQDRSGFDSCIVADTSEFTRLIEEDILGATVSVSRSKDNPGVLEYSIFWDGAPPGNWKDVRDAYKELTEDRRTAQDPRADKIRDAIKDATSHFSFPWAGVGAALLSLGVGIGKAVLSCSKPSVGGACMA
jgi:hypothetical protein